MKKEYCMEFNGYSNYIMENTPVKETKDMTVTLVFTPYTYETGISGLLCNLSWRDGCGIAIGIRKQGLVTVLLGAGGQRLRMDSLGERLVFQKENIVTIALWGTAGWCSLYLNGRLANRMQFRRGSMAVFPESCWYVGKYVDGETSLPESPRGVFHGRLEQICWTEGYLDSSSVTSLHQELMERRKEAGEEPEPDLYAGGDFSEDPYRPAYHLMPRGKWMNEPHAPFFYKGLYHIFYQANPHAPVWDNICWGHLVSGDMVDWKDAGIAMYPDREDIDPDGCWSGSACLDQEGNPFLLYTAGNNQELPNQSVALAEPEDLGDPWLKSWRKEGVILRQEPGNGFLGEFRDPFVWREGDTYYVLVGTGDAGNGGGNALLYTTRDRKHFRCHGFIADYDFGLCPEAGHVWELPVLLPLRDEEGRHGCDILMFCACQVEGDCVETYYFLGDFDREEMRFRRLHEKPRLFDLGHGIFTGGCGMVTPDGRSVIFTIAQGRREPGEEYASGWAHGGGMPAELGIRDGRLLMRPIAEIDPYFQHPVYFGDMWKKSGERPDFLAEDLTEHRILVTSQGQLLELILEWEEGSWIISYDRRSLEWKAVSGRGGSLVSRFRGSEDLVDIGEEEISLECYVDHSLVELYLNRRKSMTLRNYSICRGSRWYVQSDGFCHARVWRFQYTGAQKI